VSHDYAEIARRAREVANHGPKVRLGERWVPRYVHRCDTETGLFEVINAPLVGVIESTTQRAMLLKMPWSEKWTMRARRAVRQHWRVNTYDTLPTVSFNCGVRRIEQENP
jgi:hypothetical protein